MALLSGACRVADLVSQKQTLVDVDCEESVSRVLFILSQKNVLSAPVSATTWAAHVQRVDASGCGAAPAGLSVGAKQYMGILSVMDCVAFCMNALGPTDADFAAALAAPCHAALGTTKESLPLWVEEPLADAWPTLGRLAGWRHRALVLHAAGGDPSVLTQTDVLRYLLQEYKCDKAKGASTPLVQLVERSPRQLGLGAASSKKALVSVTEETNLILALGLMLENDLNAMPVLAESSGRLVGTLSLSDLRGTIAARLPWMATTTVAAFIQRHHPKMQWWHHPSLSWLDVPKPLTCDLDDSLIEITEAMLHGKVHRLWLVDDDEFLRPLDVITASDLIRAVVEAHDRRSPRDVAADV
ncbi:hypothetical protein M885DRAFT_577834 [Pelagophyceae sp. CCMP2097]|nr:hypothetical protein M885DRAFT_577834 [Pelagophyceae sp. CCMP2097]